MQNYWWVNQNQTFKQEIEGGYMWSPKRRSNGHRNPFYDFMMQVIPGDLVFSFADTYIKALGIIQSNAYAAPQPQEFGRIGAQWGGEGWKVDVKYVPLNNQIRPADNMDRLAAHLPGIYSPLQPNGNGNQGVYLTRLPDGLADELMHLIGAEAIDLVSMLNQVGESQPTDYIEQRGHNGLIEWEEELENSLRDDHTLSVTERKSVVLARRGQGIFKSNVCKRESFCRITGVSDITHLRASHIKPWRYCEDHLEKLNGDNGLLLTPTIDHLFDRGFISFDDNGDILKSPVANEDSLRRMGIDLAVKDNVGGFNREQASFMDYHRREVFLEKTV